MVYATCGDVDAANLLAPLRQQIYSRDANTKRSQAEIGGDLGHLLHMSQA